MTLRGRLVAVILAAGSVVAHSSAALAQWALDGVPLCTEPGPIRRIPSIAADGAGGAVVAWADLWGGGGYDIDIFAQRITASGRLAAGWPPNGIPATRAAGHQSFPVLISDDAGGAIIAWGGVGGVRAQRITGAGRVADGWPADGLPLSDLLVYGDLPAVVSDGQGGAVVVWAGSRTGTDGGIYGQRVTPFGTLAPGWPASGVRLATATLVCCPGTHLHACTDGTGGAVVTWLDGRADSRGDVYAQHVTGAGAIAEGWNVDGVGIAVAPDPIFRFSPPVIAADGAGGAIISWFDSRDGFPPVFRSGVRALRINGTGSLANGWPPEGAQVGVQDGSGDFPTITADGQSGVYIAWLSQYGRSPEGIYVQHLDGNGQVPASWPSAGLKLSPRTVLQEYPVIVADGGGGGIVTWMDYRNGAVGPMTNPDVYAQRFTVNGAIAPGWPESGVALSRAPGEQSQLTICSDGARGAIVAWENHPIGPPGDIRAARVLERGFVPPVVSVEVRPGGAKHALNPKSEGRVPVAILSTQSFDARTVLVSSVTVAGAPVSARPPASVLDVNHDGLPDLLMQFSSGAMVLSAGDSVLALEGETLDSLFIEGWGPVRIKRQALRESEVAQGETDADNPESREARLTLEKAWPVPSSGRLTVSFSLSKASAATVELLDVSGRRILTREVGSLGPGFHVTDLSPRRQLVPGVYLVRLTQGQQARSAKVIFVR